jgi:hypothetical protein
MYRLFLGVFFAVFAFFTIKAWAEDNSLTWVLPTTNEDGSALTDLANIRVYHSVNGGNFVQLAELPGTSVSYVHADQLDGEHCYYVTAVRATGAESVPSNQGCKTVDTILPDAPVNLLVN